jgi:predicted Zn-dependent protease
MDSKIGPVDEFFLGREVSARILGAYEPLSQKNPATDYVRKVGSSLSLYSHYPFPYRPYTYCVLKSNEINAFAAPGGFIFITTGMLNFLENEDELATILGHEIGHVELQHGINAVGQENVIKLLSLMAELVVESSAGDGLRENQLYNSLFNKITEKLMNKVRQGYNVEMESEADMRGIELSQLAGYDPKVFPKVLARLKKIKNNYGGANYPKERMADAIKRLKSMPECQGRHVSKVRSNRFASATRSVTN